jgi:putative ABC transport system permease protein
MSDDHPPRIALWLLRRILNRRNRDFIVDDLSEEFSSRTHAGASRWAARFWFWRQVAESITPSLRDRDLGSLFPNRMQLTLRDFFQDVRYSIRTLGKSFGFTSVAVLTLALGIGANSAVFTVVNGVLLRPLPYPDQDRLLTLWSVRPDGSIGSLPSYPDFQSWHAQSESYVGMAFIYGDEMIRRTDEGLDPMLAAYVTGEFFSTLRARAVLGSPFGNTGGADFGEEKVIVLKYGIWQGQFGGDPEIIGKTVPFADGSYTVGAVMAEGVDYPVWADMYTPITQAVIDRSGLNARDRRVDTRVFARLRTDVDQATAISELTTIASRLEAEYPETNTDWTVRIRPLKAIVLDPWGQNRNLRRALFVLMAAVGFVLLIACANIANLMLARIVSRGREMAVRTALGAGRGRLMRQTLTESLVLAALGATAGVIFARWGVDALLAGAPPLPRVAEIKVDGGVLAYTTGLAVLAALLFGTAPAMRNSGRNLVERLKEGGRSAIGRLGTRHIQVSLVVSQVGLALVLLIGAGLLGKSLRQLADVNLGFNTTQLTSVRIRPPQPQYADARLRADLYGRLVDEVAAVPGIESASLVNHTPGGGLIFSPLRVEGLAEEVTTAFKTVAPGYFETMGIAVVEGRSFDALDMTESTDGIIIDRTLARFLDIELGRRITVFKQVADNELGQPITGEVIGIVGATRVSLSQESPYPNVFVPFTVNPWMHATIVARSRSDVSGIGEQIRDAVLTVEAEIPGVEPASVADRMHETVSKERFAARLMASFAAAALLLSAVGIYGVMAYLVKQRTAEIGLRMAMGATSGHVLRLIVGRAMWMVLTGTLVGLAAAFGLTRFIGAMLFEVGAMDLSTYATVTGILVLVAFVASFLPANQATKVDPLTTLRAE